MDATTQIEGNINNYTLFSNLTSKHLAAFACLSLCFLIYVLARPYYKYVFLAVILLTLLNLVNFLPGAYVSELKISLLRIRLGLSGFPAIIGACLVNLEQLQGKLSILDEESSQRIREDCDIREAEDVLKFKDRFANKSEEELTEIMANPKFTKSAREAARLLIDQKCS